LMCLTIAGDIILPLNGLGFKCCLPTHVVPSLSRKPPMHRISRVISRLLLVFVIGLVALLPGAQPTAAQGYLLPRGFVRETVVAKLTLPTGFAFAPDGRIFITEQSGTVRVVHNGQLQATPFVDISDHVNTVGDRGLLHVAVHPRFPATPYVYL